MSAEFRIEYTIQRSLDGEEFEDVGFGSSGGWSALNQAAHIMSSDLANRGWETSPGMPDPTELETAAS